MTMMLSARRLATTTARRCITTSARAPRNATSRVLCVTSSRATATTVRYLSEAAPEEPAAARPFQPGVGTAKTSTGYVGLAVEPEWFNLIQKHFGALLTKMEASDMPETAQYRIDVTKWCNYVLAQAKAHPEDPEAVEEAVNMGQVEELIDMAKDEMIALDTYLKVRMWELVEQSNPSVDFNPNPMQDPMGEGGDPNVAEKIREGMEGMKEEKA
jgi:NADH dehydrogenase (ubiquinone) 1 alpha subcomplex subunit 5